MTRLIRRGDTARGQTLVEFALIVPLFILVTIGIFDAGRAIYTYNALSNAANEALREAIVHQDAAAIEAEANAILGGLAAETTITHNFVACVPTQTCTYGVELSYQFVPITPGLGAVFTPVMAVGGEMAVEHINP